MPNTETMVQVDTTEATNTDEQQEERDEQRHREVMVLNTADTGAATAPPYGRCYQSAPAGQGSEGRGTYARHVWDELEEKVWPLRRDADAAYKAMVKAQRAAEKIEKKLLKAATK